MLKLESFQTGLVLIAFLFSATRICAQPQNKVERAFARKKSQGQDSPQQATPAAGDPSGVLQEQSSSENRTVTPLLGGKTFGLGHTSAPTDYFVPSIQWTGYYDTNPTGNSGNANQGIQSVFVGNLQLQRASRISQFNMDYSGGATYYNESRPLAQTGSQSNYGAFHELEFTEQLTFRRWAFLVGDEGTYMPESPMGFEGLAGLSTFGSGLSGAGSTVPSVNSYFTSDQSILSQNARRFANNSIAQVQYSISPRATFNVTGSYGTLQFLEPGFIDTDYINFAAGYTYALTPRDSISVNYLNSWFHFHIPGHDFVNRGFMLAYGRQLTGRLALEFSGGMLANRFSRPVGADLTQFLLTTDDSLDYRIARYQMSVSFEHGVEGGSGLLAGSQGDMLSADVTRDFLQAYRVSFDFDNAYTKSLSQFSSILPGSEAKVWEGGVTLSRQLGSHISIYLDYQVQRQIINGAICGTSACATSFARQLGGIGINWHVRPVRLD